MLLRQYREARGLLQEELAALVEPPLSVNTIGNVERGRTRPHRHTLETLAIALGLDVEQRAELVAAWHAYSHEPAAPMIAMPRRPLALPRPLQAPPGWPGHNLPSSTSGLIGREHELDVITRQVQSSAVQLLTLTGTGGIGKSRLALAAAARLVDDFAGGVWLVQLAPVASPGQVIAAIAEAVDIPDAGGHLRENVREFLAFRRVLLVLDDSQQHSQGEVIGDLSKHVKALDVVIGSKTASLVPVIV